MRFVKIATNSYLQIENIKFTTSYESTTITKKIREMKKDGKVMDLTAGKKILCVIFLKDDTALLINSTPETINKRIEEADQIQAS